MNWFWLHLSSLVRFLLFGFSSPNESTRLWNVVDVETKTHLDWQIHWVLRLIETEKFLGCQDRDHSRLGNLMAVETKTSWDWAKDVDTQTPLRLSLISVTNVIKCKQMLTNVNRCLQILTNVNKYLQISTNANKFDKIIKW